MARFNGRWIFAKHKERSTWEIPGGRREPDEPITETARRELYEETGAADFMLTPVRIYGVHRGEERESFGGLFLGRV